MVVTWGICSEDGGDPRSRRDRSVNAEEPPHLTFLRHLPLTQEAVELAVKLHAGQRRAADGA
jgi:hypothetical protein